MSEMQAFHNWLSSTTAAPDARRERLARLTRAERSNILEATNDSTLFIWSSDQVPGSVAA